MRNRLNIAMLIVVAVVVLSAMIAFVVVDNTEPDRPWATPHYDVPTCQCYDPVAHDFYWCTCPGW